MITSLKDRIDEHLVQICTFGPRPVGSPGIHRAESYLAEGLYAAGLRVERQRFDCPYWESTGADVMLAEAVIPAVPNTFSPACEVSGTIVPLRSAEEAEAAALAGRVALLYGELTADTLAPINFPFWCPEEHRRLACRMMAGGAAGVITVSPRLHDPLAVIVDPDFSVPSATVSAQTGLALLRAAGATVRLRVDGHRRPERSANVIGRRAPIAGQKDGTLVLCAHYDTMYGTVGALDNAGGAATLLALAEALGERAPTYAIDVVFFPSEEIGGYGQVAYLASRESILPTVPLAINIDGVGLPFTRISVAQFELPPALDSAMQGVLAERPALIQVDPWPQGDHSIFVARGVPAMALSSHDPAGLIPQVTHTTWDTPEWVSPELAAEGAGFILDLLEVLGEIAP